MKIRTDSVARRVRGAVFCLSFLLVAVSYAGAPPESAADPVVGPKTAIIEPWRPLFRGIEYARAQVQEPRPLRVHAVRIDLREPTIAFLVTPSNGKEPLDTGGMRTSTFLKKHNLQVAINASPFFPFVPAEGGGQDVHGLSVSKGDCYSPPSEAYGALLITRDNKARIAAAPGTEKLDTTGVYSAVGGFRLLLKNGANVGSGGKRHPRTAAGVSKDGRYLFLVVIDGRQAGYSEGTTTAETAEWMRRFGAHDALNLDGGGSTTLVMSDPKTGARQLNRPIHAGIPGRERINANHLGVKAALLERKR